MYAWVATGRLTMSRDEHTATLLNDGRVLICCGRSDDIGPVRTAELFDPQTGACTPTGSLFYDRAGHTATLLPSGKVIVVGGADINDYTPTNTELYDPQSGEWYATGRIKQARFFHAAALLTNGRVLVAGGSTIDGPLTSAEEYDPVRQVWTVVGPMREARSGLTLTPLLDGRALAVSGVNAELYDPQSQTWSPANSFTVPRADHTATRLADGRVLIAGGASMVGMPYDPPLQASVSSCELYDPASGAWSVVGSLLSARRAHAAALSNGMVLATGGIDKTLGGILWETLSSAELFDPSSLQWTPMASMTTERFAHTLTILPAARRLALPFGGPLAFVAGGRGAQTTALASNEVYETEIFLPPRPLA